MRTITASDFVASLLRGDSEFEDLQVEGDVDLKDVVVSRLSLNNVSFSGEVTGHLCVVDKLSIRSRSCIYFADATPLIYAGSLIKDLVA